MTTYELRHRIADTPGPIDAASRRFPSIPRDVARAIALAAIDRAGEDYAADLARLGHRTTPAGNRV